MDRKDFLSLIGISAGAFLLNSCLQSCKGNKGSYPSPPSNVNMSINLSDPTYNALNQNGGYIYLGIGIIVARTNLGSYIAVSEYCTHEGVAVVYQASPNNFYCPSHGSAFGASGAVTSGPAGTALKQYSTSLNGNSLHISG
jgi:cytochrome b6-f complex iron-sulfur subunit